MQRILFGLLGLIPFIFPPMAILMGWLPSAQSQSIFLLYSAIILTFLAGSQWGYALRGSVPKETLTISIVLSLVGWFVLVAMDLSALPSRWALLLLVLGFIACLVQDYRLYRGQSAYLKLRTMLTGIVLLAHLVLSIVLMGLA
ncbi:DUF3429 domain-containing protein [Aliiglaciecola sp. CAU 1673]|uniref:DUF3429 domain-containing protein n=1 Tax=Aliiglaciecola sp. CAU 1673 TaxID=3032595 RepID=UPI0023DB39A2|nr:DUF3429 domain-containing protein [Aliiglaciecola sp. CAU 1673]MDF2180127.1 DUF3429 domain-containing protein [Aliiglaciecola sp. CAU 1673]